MRAARGATIGVAANGRWAMPNDLEILEQLNHDYVASVQHSDVGRFEEILAADFYCSNPDGSLVDRREFLEQAAHPVTISGLDARNVKIRLFGDVSRSFTRRRRDQDRALHRCLGTPARKLARRIRSCHSRIRPAAWGFATVGKHALHGNTAGTPGRNNGKSNVLTNDAGALAKVPVERFARDD